MSHRGDGRQVRQRTDSNDVPAWLRHSLMVGIFLVWCAFMLVSLQGTKVQDIPLPLWTVPGASYGLLYGKLPKFGKSGGDR